MELCREEARARIEAVESERSEDRSRVEQLVRAADEVQSLKDELDELRARAEQVTKLEATLEQWKKRVDEASDLRRQLKALEEKNLELVQQNLTLEEVRYPFIKDV